MRYFYHVTYRKYDEKKWHHISKRFTSYEEAEKALDSKDYDESRIQLKRARQ